MKLSDTKPKNRYLFCLPCPFPAMENKRSAPGPKSWCRNCYARGGPVCQGQRETPHLYSRQVCSFLFLFKAAVFHSGWKRKYLDHVQICVSACVRSSYCLSGKVSQLSVRSVQRLLWIDQGRRWETHMEAVPTATFWPTMYSVRHPSRLTCCWGSVLNVRDRRWQWFRDVIEGLFGMHRATCSGRNLVYIKNIDDYRSHACK